MSADRQWEKIEGECDSMQIQKQIWNQKKKKKKKGLLMLNYGLSP